MDEVQQVATLVKCLEKDQRVLQPWDAYYEGKQALSYMAPELAAELKGLIRPVVLNWPRLVIDALEERLDVEGFRFGADEDADDTMWAWWQANDLDVWSQQAHVEALTLGRSFVIVGSSDDPDVPLMTVESPFQVYAELDPRTREVRSAVKAWRDEKQRFATLYLPDATIRYEAQNTGRSYVEIDRDDHNLGTVPVVPIVNRGRVLQPLGVSELADVVPLSDAACKLATDMMVGAEFHAIPRRWALNIGPEDFTDKDGNVISEWSQIAGRIWSLEGQGKDGADVKVGQFEAADLKNFIGAINALASQVSAISGLPPTAVGLTTDNPASADAIRAAEARLVKRAERRQRAFGGAWEAVMRLGLKVVGAEEGPAAQSLETLWASSSTPTTAQAADAAVKLVAAEIIPGRQALEDLGYTKVQIARIDKWLKAETAAQVLAAAEADAKNPTPPDVPPGGANTLPAA